MGEAKRREKREYGEGGKCKEVERGGRLKETKGGFVEKLSELKEGPRWRSC